MKKFVFVTSDNAVERVIEAEHWDIRGMPDSGAQMVAFTVGEAEDGALGARVIAMFGLMPGWEVMDADVKIDFTDEVVEG